MRAFLKWFHIDTNLKSVSFGAYSGNTLVFVCNCTKHWFIIENKLLWSPYIQILAKMCYAQLRPLVRPLISNDNMIQIVNSLVLSNSMSVIWGSANQKHLQLITKVVKNPVRLVLKKKWLDHISNLWTPKLANAFFSLQEGFVIYQVQVGTQWLCPKLPSTCARN
jgi:hypothetical protein